MEIEGTRSTPALSLCAVFLAVTALSTVTVAFAATPDVSTTGFEGWTDHGRSIDTGVYARGGTSNDYQVFTTVFLYDDSTPVAGTSSGFVNGNKIFGIGIRFNDGAPVGYPVIKLDPDNNSYFPSPDGVANGQASFSSNADLGDSIIHFQGVPIGTNGDPSEITIRNSGALVANGPPCEYTGGSCFYLPVGGNWGGGGQPGFRGIKPADGVWKMFFDLDEMTAEFGEAGSRNLVGPHLGAFGDTITFASGGQGTEVAVQNVSLLIPADVEPAGPKPVPTLSEWALLLLSGLVAGFGGWKLLQGRRERPLAG